MTVPAVAQLATRGPGALAVRDVPGRRERLGQVHDRRGRRRGVRARHRGRLDRQPALDPQLRVAAGQDPPPAARARREPAGLLPAGRDDARLLQLPRGQPEADGLGRGAAVPRDEPRRVVPRGAAHPLRLARLLLPRRAGGGAVVLVDARPDRHAGPARRERRPGAVRHPLAGAGGDAGRHDPRGRRLGPAAYDVGGARAGPALEGLPRRPRPLPAPRPATDLRSACGAAAPGTSRRCRAGAATAGPCPAAGPAASGTSGQQRAGVLEHDVVATRRGPPRPRRSSPRAPASRSRRARPRRDG